MFVECCTEVRSGLTLKIFIMALFIRSLDSGSYSISDATHEFVFFTKLAVKVPGFLLIIVGDKTNEIKLVDIFPQCSVHLRHSLHLFLSAVSPLD